MKSLTTVSCVVFLHILAFVVLVNGCSTRASRARENAGNNEPQSGVYTSAPTAGETTQPSSSAPTAGAQIEDVPSEPLPAEPEPVSELSTEQKSAEGEDYVVKKGDSLWLIAKKHKTSIAAICDANGINKNAILRAGMKLKIPAGTQNPEPSKSEKPADGEIYTVKKGDALSIIARRHGVSVKALKSANNLSSDNIRVGQKLVIPAKKADAKKDLPAKKEAVPAKPVETSPASVQEEVLETKEPFVPEEPAEGAPAEPVE